MVKVETLTLVNATILAKQLTAYEQAGLVVTLAVYIPVQGSMGKLLVAVSDMADMLPREVSIPQPEEVSAPSEEIPAGDAPIEQAQATITVEHHPAPPKNGNGNGASLPAPEVLPAVQVQ